MEIAKEFVTSSNIEAVGYNEDSETLRIWFLNGSVYDYFGIKRAEFEALRDAPSVGSYLNRNIKGQYSYEKVG